MDDQGLDCVRIVEYTLDEPLSKGESEAFEEYGYVEENVGFDVDPWADRQDSTWIRVIDDNVDDIYYDPEAYAASDFFVDFDGEKWNIMLDIEDGPFTHESFEEHDAEGLIRKVLQMLEKKY
ncbi:hypothetical protein ACFL2Q_02515 [Thermodesulfobacteriota bacterium]